MKGFVELLDSIKTRILSGDFKKTFDNNPLLDTGTACRILNDHPLDPNLSKTILADFPEEIFNPPYLELVALSDPSSENYEAMVKRRDEIEKILKPYLDEVTFRISLTLLNTTRTELSDTTKGGLSRNFEGLKINQDEFIIGLYSSVIALFWQAVVTARDEKLGIRASTHGGTEIMSDETIGNFHHFNVLQNIIQKYQEELAIEKIKEISLEPEVLIKLGEEYTKKEMLLEAIECYKSAYQKDPKVLPNSVDSLLDLGKNYLNKNISIEERTRVSREIGDILINFSIGKLSEIAVKEAYFPISDSYHKLNTQLSAIIKLKSEYEQDPSDKNFSAMMKSIDTCIKAFESTPKTNKAVWEEKFEPVFKALLAGVILIVLSVASIGIAPAYLMMHSKERKAVVDSFFNQDKGFKERLSDFKKRIEEVKQIGKAAEEKAKEEKKMEPLEIEQGHPSAPGTHGS